MTEIATVLKGWQPRGGLESYRLYGVYRDSNYIVLPVSGGWLDQPAWWIDDVQAFQLLEEWHYLNSKLASPNSLPVYGG